MSLLKLNFFIYAAFLNSIMAFSLGLFVFIKNPKEKINIFWLLMSLCVCVWSFSMGMAFRTVDYSSALFWYRLQNFIAILIPIFFLHFVISFLNIIRKKVLIFTYFTSFAIFFLSILFPSLFIPGVGPSSIFKYYLRAAITYHFFTINFWAISIYAHYLLLLHYFKALGIKKNQIKYILLGGIVGFIGGGSTFVNVYFPNVKFPPYGNCLMWIYVLCVTYAIIRHKLLEIDTVIHKTLLWIVTSLWLVIPAYVIFRFTHQYLTSISTPTLTLYALFLFYIFLWYHSVIQPKIDHLFRRRKYDYQKVLAEIPTRIGTELVLSKVANRLLLELKETMYIRNSLFLVLNPENNTFDQHALSGYTPEQKTTLASDHALTQYLARTPKSLEKDQIEVDPQYEQIKQPSLDFFNQNSLELLIPVLMPQEKTLAEQQTIYQLNALIGLGKKESLRPYTIKDIELLANLGRQIGITIDNALHHQDLVETERLAEELRLGRDIQMDLLPKTIPQIPGLSLSGFMQPAKEIGGDYYDFITLPKQDQLGIAIGDVSGKGVAAGLMMAVAKTAIYSISQQGFSPKDILLNANQVLFKHIGGQKFMTLLYLYWDSKTSTLHYSSAGHEHIIYYQSKTKTTRLIKSGGVILGMVKDIEQHLENKQIPLSKGDRVILYTDGVTEAENSEGERFGLSRLKQAVDLCANKPPQQILKDIREELHKFMGTHPQYDDITLVGMGRE